MRKEEIETALGGAIVVVAAALLVIAYTTAGIRRTEGYAITMRFDRVDGLRPGSDVRMSGIRIGSVTQQTLDQKTYRAIVTASIEPSVKLPADTSAEISTEGLIGDKFIALVPGGSDEMVPPGGEIEYTQGSVDIIDLISRFTFSRTAGEAKSKAGEGSSPSANRDTR